MIENTGKPALGAAMRERYEELRGEIAERLGDFSRVPHEAYFYELCYCLLTPQSKARNAAAVVETLQKRGFAEQGFDPTELLAATEHYIRFHNVKAGRLLTARQQTGELRSLLSGQLSPQQERDWLVGNVGGLGMKEASHFLRNIGRRGLAILDRHIIKCLAACGIDVDAGRMGSRKYYEETERRWLDFCAAEAIPIDEMDLLFWSAETGEILK